MQEIASLVFGSRLHLLGYVHDSVYVLSLDGSDVLDSFHAIASSMHAKTGLILALKAVDGSVRQRFRAPSPMELVLSQAETISYPDDVQMICEDVSRQKPDQKAARFEDEPRNSKSFTLFDFSTESPVDMLRDVYNTPHNCIAWACLALKPELAQVDTFLTIAATAGPRRYQDIADVMRKSLVMEPILPGSEAHLMPGSYLRHCAGTAEHMSHCSAVRILDRQPYEIVPNAMGEPITRMMSEDELRSSCLIMLLGAGEATRSNLGDPIFNEIAGMGRKAASSKSFENKLANAAKSEADYWVMKCNAYGKRHAAFGRVAKRWICPMCPTKVCCKKQHLKTHMVNTHVKSSGKSAIVFGTKCPKQRGLMKDMWDNDQITGSLHNVFGTNQSPRQQGFYLSRSAKLLRVQLIKSPSWWQRKATLQKKSVRLQYDIVTLLDHDSARYILEEDARVYHRVSKKFYATDSFLQTCFCVMLHPDNDSVASIMRMLRDKYKQSADQLPADSGPICISLIDALLKHPSVMKACTECRRIANKKVLAIDAQFSTLMNVLYQVPHGSNTEEGANDANESQHRHCIHTVRAADTLLLTVTRKGEGFEDQFASLSAAVVSAEQGDTSTDEVEMIYSDAPARLDKARLYSGFQNLCCLAKDPIHVALKVEKAFNGRSVELTNRLRIVMHKFAYGQDDGHPYYKQGGAIPHAPKLNEVTQRMSKATAQRRVPDLYRGDYGSIPYRRALDFLKDIAALTIVYEKDMRRQTGKSATVRSSLAFASCGVELQYLFNGSRYIARNPNVQVPYGSTACEAVHAELKRYFALTRQQTARHAETLTSLFCMKKLITAIMQRLDLSKTMLPRELLRSSCASLQSMSLDWNPRLELLGQVRPKVNLRNLPANAKIAAACKRPARR